jgi:Domain of unknown function (DUF4232)
MAAPGNFGVGPANSAGSEPTEEREMAKRGTRRLYGAAVSGCCAAVLAVAVMPASARITTASRCKSSQTEVWLGLGLGGGTLGTTYYPLEFSNVSHSTCTFYGYPGVSAYRGALSQVGPAARRNRHAHALVTLAPDETAHALLGVIDWGAVCSRSVTADGLRVFPPGQRIAQAVPFSFPACAHRGILTIGPIRGGVGVPGFSGP